MINESQLNLWNKITLNRLIKGDCVAEVRKTEFNVAEMKAISACKNEVVFKNEWMKLYAVFCNPITYHAIIKLVLERKM